MWAPVAAPANAEPTPIHGLVTAGMNDVLNREGYREAAWRNRVPVSAWLLMTFIAIFSNGLVGFRAGGKPSALFLNILPIALSISFFLVADIDSPRRGIIHVNPQNLPLLADSLRQRP